MERRLRKAYESLSMKQLVKRMGGIHGSENRDKYLWTVINNPDTPPDTRRNAKRLLSLRSPNSQRLLPMIEETDKLTTQELENKIRRVPVSDQEQYLRNIANDPFMHETTCKSAESLSVAIRTRARSATETVTDVPSDRRHVMAVRTGYQAPPPLRSNSIREHDIRPLSAEGCRRAQDHR